MLSRATLATIAGLAICDSLGVAASDAPLKGGMDESKTEWEFSLETLTYLAQHERDYSNPNFLADYGQLHLEARYNYEALKTGSVWLGYNYEKGENLKFEVTPMLGGVFGDITGVAPGCEIRMTYNKNKKTLIELATEGEYFFDAGTSSGNFYYSWSEFSAYPIDRFRVGIVVERTQASGNSDVRRGPLVGFTSRDEAYELTAYWLSPGSRQATFVFGVNLNFGAPKK